MQSFARIHLLFLALAYMKRYRLKQKLLLLETSIVMGISDCMSTWSYNSKNRNRCILDGIPRDGIRQHFKSHGMR
jgi:hypothetical protein